MPQCPCAELDWTGCDQTTDHHPECQKSSVYQIVFKGRVIQNGGGRIFKYGVACPSCDHTNELIPDAKMQRECVKCGSDIYLQVKVTI